VSLLLLFQGGGAGLDIPVPPAVVLVPLDFLPHGVGAIGPGATLAVGPAAGLAVVGPGQATEIGGGHAATVGPGAKTTIQ
jgi:hypothetical protein